ncbi:MAG TPA: cupin domain-containing protein [Chloroflexota bacterium]|jgi:quercetin dioxygenase-like cupin family protein|nr:cupin domain-containing protein [Chloroflexota bacterium]
MAEPSDRPHPGPQTSGSPERPPQQLVGPHLVFDLAAESAQIRYERGYREGDRNANTLVKTDGLRVVLTALRKGTRLQEHVAPGWTSVHALEGRLRLRFPDQTVELPAGHLLALAPRLPHDVEALEDSVFLLTIATAD